MVSAVQRFAVDLWEELLPFIKFLSIALLLCIGLGTFLFSGGLFIGVIFHGGGTLGNHTLPTREANEVLEVSFFCLIIAALCFVGVAYMLINLFVEKNKKRSQRD